MTEWWTYGPADLLMFSPATYWRLFELHNAALWPAQGPAVALGVCIAVLGWRGADRAMCALLALAWLWVGWSFHAQRLSAVHWAAPGFAAAFALQALLLAAHAAARNRGGPRAWRVPGALLWLLALAGQPLLALALGRPLSQTEWFGLMPDPTVLATLGALLLLPRGGPAWLWPLPLAWCGFSAATLWAMHAPDAFWLPAAAAAALATRLGLAAAGPSHRR